MQTEEQKPQSTETPVPAQDFGDDPISQRDTNHYQMEYIHSFVEKWDELIDWDRRAQGEGGFFIERLKELGVQRVLDVATGTGFHSVQLLRHGFDVTSVDGSPYMLSKAFENARRRGYVLRTVHADWRMLSRDVQERFDAVICLGNSFTHLFNERDRRKALAEFYAVLNHDGVLVLDQRNYDAMLDDQYSTDHTYYYCGEDVRAEPEYIDDGLARFRYVFSDDSTFHLNMFPLRKDYLRKLMTDVGFQRVITYGDFEETYRDEDPDFFVHIAAKKYQQDDEYSSPTRTAREYYNSDDADSFYHTIWGGEDIHVGIYEKDADTIFDASRRTVERMLSMLPKLNRRCRVLDLGAGYGGAARHIAGQTGARVVCLNLSEKQNERNRLANKKAGLEDLVEVIDGTFEDVPFPDNWFDVVWSEDAILHSGDRAQVLAEANRVLKPGGSLIFTDPMQSDDCPVGELQPIYDRILLDSLASFGSYRQIAAQLGMQEAEVVDLSEQLPRHYAAVRADLERRYQDLVKQVSREYMDRMLAGLQHWVDGGESGYLTWGILHFRKEA